MGHHLVDDFLFLTNLREIGMIVFCVRNLERSLRNPRDLWTQQIFTEKCQIWVGPRFPWMLSNKRIMAGLFQILPAVYNQTWQWHAPINGHLNGNIIYKWGIFQDTMLDSQTIVKKCSINIPPILHSIQLPIISPPMEKTHKISIFHGTQHLNVGWITVLKFPDLIPHHPTSSHRNTLW